MKTSSYASLFLTFFVISSAMLLFTDSTFSQTTECNYYASPTGTGNGLSRSSPFKIVNFWAVAQPGTTLCLLAGTYKDNNSMIQPPEGLHGTSGARITVRCISDGTCDIDGEGVRSPVWLPNNNYFTLERFDAHDSDFGVITVGTNGAAGTGLIIRRVVAWNANPNGDYDVFGMY